MLMIVAEFYIGSGISLARFQVFLPRFLSRFLDRSDPRSKGIDRLITSEPTLDQGSVLVVGNKLEVMYFTTRTCPTNLII